jgi:hypothetical protein
MENKILFKKFFSPPNLDIDFKDFKIHAAISVPTITTMMPLYNDLKH